MQWPKIEYNQFKDTYLTLQRFVQIIGKIKISHHPWTNHSWHSALYTTPVGFTTLAFACGQGRSLSIDIDLIRHRVDLVTSEGTTKSISLQAMPVAKFYINIVDALVQLKVNPQFDRKPNEVPDAILFHKDDVHCTYDPEQAALLMQAFQKADLILKEFRSDFVGKASPVHFFWGSFDLAVTRFSGREAPEHTGHFPNLPDRIVKESYSQEVSSCGFWPGNDYCPYPAFYSYAYPAPSKFSEAKVKPEAAFFHPELQEFILPYDSVRADSQPEKLVMQFLQTTYEAAADLGNWNRQNLEPGKFLNECRSQMRLIQ